MIPYAFVNITIKPAVVENNLGFTGYIPTHTETIRYDQFVQKLVKPQTAQLMKLHAALGCAGEAGELADAIKKECIYGKAPDRKNIIEELGDLQWYIQLTMLLYDITPTEVFQTNADKLSERYVKLTYSDAEALARADKKE